MLQKKYGELYDEAGELYEEVYWDDYEVTGTPHLTELIENYEKYFNENKKDKGYTESVKRMEAQIGEEVKRVKELYEEHYN